MSKLEPIPTPGSSLRTYASRYTGGVLLACGKCQRKLKRAGDHTEAAKLRKSLKKLARQNGSEPIHVIAVSCLKLCPKGAVTVCTPQNLASIPPTLTLIRTPDDIAALYRQTVDPHRHTSRLELVPPSPTAIP